MLVCKMWFFINRFLDFVLEKFVFIDKFKWYDNVVVVVKIILERMLFDLSICLGGLYVGNMGVGYMFYYLVMYEVF